MILDLAAEPTFHLSEFNGIESAQLANVYDALIFLGKNQDYNSIT